MNKTNSLSASEFFGWKRHPFVDSSSTSPEISLIKRDHQIFERAREFLKVGRSFAIIGNAGSGKTSLVRSIAQSLDPRSWKILWIPYAGCKRNGILRVLAEKLGLELGYKGLPPLPRLQRHLANSQKEPASAVPVIIVDDAQHLEAESLMDLCSILSHPDEQSPLASMILVGDEALERTLRLACRKAISTRMAYIFRMEPISPDDAKNILEARIEQSGAPKKIFEDDALELVATQSHGNRRELMNLATTLCVEAHLRNEKVITAELVLTTIPM